MKVTDIRPEELMVGQRAAMKRDIESLKSERARFVKVVCPACGIDGAEHLYEKFGVDHVRCNACSTQYVNPRPDADLLQEFYANSENYAFWAKHVYPATKKARREMIFKPRAEIVRRIAHERNISNGMLVEVGAGYGLFCDEMRKLGHFSRIAAIEPTPHLATVCRDMGFEVIEASFEHADLDQPADMIAAFEVVEHLFSPRAFLKWCFRSLAPGGHLLLTCPNIGGFETRTLERDSQTIDHQHINLFLPTSLSSLASNIGFAEISVITPGRLDFDIVRSAYRAGIVSSARLGLFLTSLLETDDPSIGEHFQDFLVEAGLSSNMRMLAQRPPTSD